MNDDPAPGAELMIEGGADAGFLGVIKSAAWSLFGHEKLVILEF
jgi:hypothetical protein